MALFWLAEQSCRRIPRHCLSGRGVATLVWHGVCVGAHCVWRRCPRRCRRRSSAVAGRRADWPWRRSSASLYGHDSGAAWAVRDHGSGWSASGAMWPLLGLEDHGRGGGGQCGAGASSAGASWCGADPSDGDTPWLAAAVAEWALVLCRCDAVAPLRSSAQAEPAKWWWVCVLQGASKYAADVRAGSGCDQVAPSPVTVRQHVSWKKKIQVVKK